MTRWIPFLIVCGLAWVAQAKITPDQIRQLPPAMARPVDFRSDIKPILEASCVKCHARGQSKGGLRIESRELLLKGGDSGPAIVQGNSAESYLIELVSGLNPDNVMPNKGSRLTPDQVSLLRAWIDQGLKWDAEITFAKPPPNNLLPRKVVLPPGDGHPIDRLLASYLATNGIVNHSRVRDGLFTRRVFLDVVGLLPSPAEVQAFENDSGPDKRVRLVRRLLQDNQGYTEHWLTFWNDALRNDYRGTGYIDGGRKQITTWLYHALYTNMPYDRFVAELVNPRPESEGFAKGIVWRGVVNASQTPEMQAAQNISQVFMGVNLKCASCHDSFINDWTLADAYGLANIYSEKPLELFQCDKPTGKMASTKFIYSELGELNGKAGRAERLDALAKLITGSRNGRLSRTIVNRLWAKFMGRGLVEPLDDMEQSAWHKDLLDWLAEDLAEHGYDLKHTIERILTSEAYQMASIAVDEQQTQHFVFRGPVVRRMAAEQFRDGVGEVTGVWYAQPGGDFDLSLLQAENLRPDAFLRGKWIWNTAEAVNKAVPGTVYFRKAFRLSRLPKEALGVVSCDNSFTVYLNGAKIGSGKDYTRPSLLDLLPHLKVGENVIAIAAVNHTPDNKPPSTSKPIPASAANPAGLYVQLQAGPDDMIISDSSWVCSTNHQDGWQKAEFGRNDWEQASDLGPAPMRPWNLAANLKHVLGALALKDKARAAYVAADSLMVALGRPNREQVITSRPSAATTLQALELTNGNTLARVLQAGAEQITKAGKTSDVLVTELFWKALGREPGPQEKELSMELVRSPVQREGVEDLLWSLVMLPEFQLIY